MAYWYTFKLSVLRMSMYRLQILSRVLGDIVFLTMWVAVWKALYATGATHSNISESQMTLYVLFTQFLVGTMNNSNFLFRLQAMVRSGDLAIELIRPYQFLLRNLSEDLGKMMFYLCVSGIPVYGIAFFILHLQVSTNIGFCLCFIVSAILGILIKYQVEFTFGLLTLWVVEIGGMNPLFFFTVQALAGAVVPLWYFPFWLNVMADWLPFQGMYFLPASILALHLGWSATFKILILQTAWVVILFLCSQITWQIGTRRLMIQGG